jgi:hypothetical protein
MNKVVTTCAVFSALVMGACSPLTYSSHVKVAKYEYDGVRYDVYQADKTKAGQSATTVYRLIEEGVDPKNLDSHSLVQFGDNGAVVTECAGNLEECRTQFGAVLERRKTSKTPDREKSGMGY